MGRASCPQLWMVEAVRVGQLAPEQAAQLRQHLQFGCSACKLEQRYLDWLNTSLLEREPARDEVALRRLRQATLNRAHDKLYRASPSRWRDRRWMLSAVVAVLAAFVTWHGLGRTPEVVVTPLTAAGPVRRSCESGREVVVLGDGVYELSVRRGLFDRHVVVKVPEGEIHDVGTVFGVSVQQGRTARVAVIQGAVDLHLRGVPEMRLNAGNVWEATPRLELEEMPVTPAPEAASVAPVAVDEEAKTSAHVSGHAGVLHRRARGHVRREARGASDASHVSDAGVADIETAGEDATYLRVLDLLQQRRTADAQRLAELYLERFPTGFRRPEIERIVRPRQRLE
jgi:hypothetical protein